MEEAKAISEKVRMASTSDEAKSVALAELGKLSG
jgi:hypothetical protein